MGALRWLESLQRKVRCRRVSQDVRAKAEVIEGARMAPGVRAVKQQSLPPISPDTQLGQPFSFSPVRPNSNKSSEWCSDILRWLQPLVGCLALLRKHKCLLAGGPTSQELFLWQSSLQISSTQRCFQPSLTLHGLTESYFLCSISHIAQMSS